MDNELLTIDELACISYHLSMQRKELDRVYSRIPSQFVKEQIIEIDLLLLRLLKVRCSEYDKK